MKLRVRPQFGIFILVLSVGLLSPIFIQLIQVGHPIQGWLGEVIAILGGAFLLVKDATTTLSVRGNCIEYRVFGFRRYKINNWGSTQFCWYTPFMAKTPASRVFVFFDSKHKYGEMLNTRFAPRFNPKVVEEWVSKNTNAEFIAEDKNIAFSQQTSQPIEGSFVMPKWRATLYFGLIPLLILAFLLFSAYCLMVLTGFASFGVPPNSWFAYPV